MRRNVFQKLGVTLERLRELYETEGKTDAEIGVLFGVSDVAVSYFRRKWGIGKKASPLEALTREELERLYTTKSDAEIALLHGVSKTAVRLKRHREGVGAISKTERVEQRRESPAPEPQPEIAPLESPVELKPSEQFKVPTIPATPYRQTAEYREREAERARQKRADFRIEHPVKMSRTFTCDSCGKLWETEAQGNFRTCPACKEQVDAARRTKVCPHCGTTFQDETEKLGQTYCKVECRRRAKLLRSGKAPEGGFLADRTLTCAHCHEPFVPTIANQFYCKAECRLSEYAGESLDACAKVCQETGKEFIDESLKNNRRYDDQAARGRVQVKVDPTRQPVVSTRTLQRRGERMPSGLGGRMDDIRTLKKYTNSWWGRASETVFAAYRPKARDLVIEASNRSPYDFHDEELGRIEVRGAARTMSPQGHSMWLLPVRGLRESCDHVFFVGYSEDKTRVEHLWLFPSSKVPGTLIRCSPSSSEYRWGLWDISSTWGLMTANETLKSLHALLETERPKDRFAWLDDPTQFDNPLAPGHRGRHGEFLYRGLYPSSKDMNRELGSGAQYDFGDADGTKVNVKVARPTRKSEHSTRWTFSMGHSPAHNCDVYSCLCLSEDGLKVLAEYRIPATVWGDKRTIHIYETGGQWEAYRVPPKQT